MSITRYISQAWERIRNLFLTVPALFTPALAAAQPAGRIQDVCSLINVISRITNLAFFAVGLLTVLFLLYSGFLFLTAGANEDTLKKAKQWLIYGIIGIAVALLAFSIPDIVGRLLGVGEFRQSCP